MRTRWFIAIVVGFMLTLSYVAPTLAGFEGGDPNSHADGHEQATNTGDKGDWGEDHNGH